MRLRFGEFVLDTAARALVRAGGRVTLEPQVYRCIELLARQAGQLTALEQLRETLWPGVTVASGSLRRTIREARRALGDDGSSQAVIRTRKGLGYEFALEVIDESRVRESQPAWPFVGRDRELACLREWLASSRAGVCFVSGEAGAGKSTLLSQLSAASRELCWLTGRCHSALGQPAFWPFRELGRQLLEDPSLRGPALALLLQRPELVRLIPELGGGERTPPLEAAVSSELRFELAERLSVFLRALARVRPLVLALEDLHWADDGSVVLLEALARATPEQNLHVLVTYRPEALPANAALAALIARASGRAGAISLDLQPLGVEAVRVLLEALRLAGAASASEAAQSLWRLTGGNALYVHELLHHALATGVSLGGSLPPSLQQILAARLESVPESTVERLGQAAVLGDDFDLGELATLAGRTPAELDRELEPALLGALLRRSASQPAALGFSHALVREALLNRLPPYRLQDHHRAALALLRGLPPSATSSARLALHAFEAGALVPQSERRSLCEQAGRESLAALAFERAALQLGRALQLTAADDPAPEAAELALACAYARWHADESESAVEAAFFDAAERARRAGSAELLCEAAIGLTVGDESSLSLRHAYLRPNALELLDEAWQRLGDAPGLPNRLAYRVASTLCFVQAEAGELAGTRSAAHRALRLAPRALEPIARLWQQFLRVFAEPEGAVAQLDEIEAALREPRLDPRRCCDLLPLLMAARLAHGELAGWGRAAAEAERLAALLPQSPRSGRAGVRRSIYLGMQLCTPVTRAVISGRLAEAEALWHAATREAERLGFTASREGIHDAFHILLQLYGYQGRGHVLEPWVDKRVQDHPESRWFAALLKAQFALERGLPADAARHFALLRETELQPALGRRKLFARPETLLRLADACVEVGTADDAQKIYAWLEPWAGSYVQDGALIFWGTGARALGELALSLERWSDAEKHLRSALALNERAGHRPELARSQLGLARLHRTRGGHAQARTLLSQVVQSATEMGMTGLAERALALTS